jgi:hypothetical protein
MKKRSWDEIPSLDGVGVDWGYKPQTRLNNRSCVRLDMKILSQLFEVQKIVVKLATMDQVYNGSLIDVSASGLAIYLPVLLEVDLSVKVGFFLGSEKIISQGLVKHARHEGDRFITGLQFIDLAPESAQYIAGLYAAKVLSHPV